MSSSLAAITFDCNDASALASFWAQVLDLPIDPDPSTAFTSVNRDGGAPGPLLLFAQVDEPKAAKKRVHLDLDASDRDAEVARLLGLGATRVYDKHEWGIRWTTLTDPEGNAKEHGEDRSAHRIRR